MPISMTSLWRSLLVASALLIGAGGASAQTLKVEPADAAPAAAPAPAQQGGIKGANIFEIAPDADKDPNYANQTNAERKQVQPGNNAPMWRDVGQGGVTGTTSLTFGGTPASSFTVNSSTSITAIAPAHAAGPVNVVLTTPAGTATSVSAYTYLAIPNLSSVTPNSGPIGGGTSVTLTGTGLTGASSVTFGGVSATGWTINSPTQITATIPAGNAGVVGGSNNVVANVAQNSRRAPARERSEAVMAMCHSKQKNYVPDRGFRRPWPANSRPPQ